MSKTCPKCGNKVDDNALACDKCGLAFVVDAGPAPVAPPPYTAPVPVPPAGLGKKQK